MNKNKSGVFVIPFLFLFLSISQGTEIDSLQIELQRKIAMAASDSLNLIDAYYQYGEYFAMEGNVEAAIEQFERAFHIADSYNNATQVAKAGNYLANMYAAMGDFKSSNNTYLKALKAAEKTKNGGEIAKISMNLASNYNFIGKYQQAIKYGLYALSIKESTQNLERICYHYIAMGNIFRENSNNLKWEEYVQKAYEMKDVEGCASTIDIVKIYNSLGGIEVQKEAYEKALLYYDTLRVISQDAEYDQGISTALTNSAGVYRQLGNISRALELAIDAEQYFGENPYDIIFSNNFKAEIYQQMGEPEKALVLAKQNMKREEIHNYSTEKLKNLQLLYELNFALSYYKQAFMWNDSLRHIEKILRDADVRESIEEMETAYETKKKEQRIELLMAENRLKNQRLNAGIGLVFFLLIVISLISYLLRIRKKQAILVQNDLQQQVLRSQMNPHFIFNVLGSIQNFIMHNDKREASKYLSQFASLTRATLNNSAVESISLIDEIQMLKDYIELERMRSPGKFDYRVDYDENMETEIIRIPPMLIQPFVENAIKHAFRDLNRPGMVRLSITDQDDWVECIVEDNGVGLDKEHPKAHPYRSMAIGIFEKRRKLIQQRYGKEFSCEIVNLRDTDQELSGVKVRIKIPVLNND